MEYAHQVGYANILVGKLFPKKKPALPVKKLPPPAFAEVKLSAKNRNGKIIHKDDKAN